MKTFDEQLLWVMAKIRPLVAARDGAEVASQALRSLLELTDSARAYAFVLAPSGGQVHEVDRVGEPLPEPADRRIAQVAHHCCKEAAVAMASPEASSPLPAVRRALSELRLNFLVCLPLVVERRPFGALYADCRLPRPNPPAERIFRLLADLVSIAWENARLFERAANDALTGLPNESSLLAQLGRVMQAQEGSAELAGLLLLDLDAFKRINVAAGHEMGNRALRDVALTLREALGADGMVARVGSDKFAIVLAPDPATAIALRLHDVAERARATVATKNYHAVALTACIGGIAFGRGGLAGPEPAEVVERANAALATARARGPGQVEIMAAPG